MMWVWEQQWNDEQFHSEENQQCQFSHRQVSLTSVSARGQFSRCLASEHHLMERQQHRQWFRGRRSQFIIGDILKKWISSAKYVVFGWAVGEGWAGGVPGTWEGLAEAQWRVCGHHGWHGWVQGVTAEQGQRAQNHPAHGNEGVQILAVMLCWDSPPEGLKSPGNFGPGTSMKNLPCPASLILKLR